VFATIFLEFPAALLSVAWQFSWQ